MTTDVKKLLTAFDALTPGEQHEAALELLRRLSAKTPYDISDEALTALAEERFLELDAREADDARC